MSLAKALAPLRSTSPAAPIRPVPDVFFDGDRIVNHTVTGDKRTAGRWLPVRDGLVALADDEVAGLLREGGALMFVPAPGARVAPLALFAVGDKITVRAFGTLPDHTWQRVAPGSWAAPGTPERITDPQAHRVLLRSLADGSAGAHYCAHAPAHLPLPGQRQHPGPAPLALDLSTGRAWLPLMAFDGSPDLVALRDPARSMSGDPRFAAQVPLTVTTEQVNAPLAQRTWHERASYPGIEVTRNINTQVWMRWQTPTGPTTALYPLAAR